MRVRPSASSTPTTIPALRFSSTRCLMIARIAESDGNALAARAALDAAGCAPAETGIAPKARTEAKRATAALRAAGTRMGYTREWETAGPLLKLGGTWR